MLRGFFIVRYCTCNINTIFRNKITIDDITTLTTPANGDGCLRVSNIGSRGLDGVTQELPVAPSYHWVIAKEVDDSRPQGAKYAIGFFSYIPNGKIIGDEDWDGDVDDTIGLYDPATAMFHLRNSNSTGVADSAFYYGPPGGGWIPVAGEWDGL